MSGKDETYTQIESNNEFSFGFPYEGKQRAQLMVRDSARQGRNVVLSIKRGQFMCGVSTCPVLVRFDDGKASTYTAVGTTDHDPKVLFIVNQASFVQNLRKAKIVRVETDVYHEGRRIFEFKAEGFAHPVVQ